MGVQCSCFEGLLKKGPPPVYESHHFNSKKWEVVKPRSDDIVIVTAYKSGTTWMQQIVAEILFQGKPKPATVGDMSPWVDLRVPPAEVTGPAIECMAWRRFLKTHLPADAFEPFITKSAKYIYVGRAGLDAFMSLMNHYEKANDTWYGSMNGPGLVGPPTPKFDELGGVEKIFDRWISEGWPTLPNETDGWPFWSLFHNVRTWWEWGQANPKQILFVHYNNLLSDLKGEMIRIAKFLEVEIDMDLIDGMVKSCTFEDMKQKANAIAPLNGVLWKGGGNDFIFKGTNGRWQGVLSEMQQAAYKKKLKQALSNKAATWLETGKL